MQMKLTATAIGGQDGAFYGNYLFRFNAKGLCRVWDATKLDEYTDTPVALPQIGEFSLPENSLVIPHFNAVVFGTEFYAEGDEFPLLYANVYNNYAKAEDRREGMCCVYRLQRSGTAFAMTLVQIIQIGFVRDSKLWISGGEVTDVRPYGNFVIDTDQNRLVVFTMRDGDHTARYFTFALPKLSDGTFSQKFGVNIVTLKFEDIIDYFDTEYHLYIQGACCHDGKVYSSEGFNEKRPTALRVISLTERKQLHHTNLVEMGYPTEAEFMDFRNGICYYGDAAGNYYRVDFE